jgi:hypothetical protein
MASAREKTPAPAAIQKQLQKCIVTNCMSWIYQMDVMKLTQIHQKMLDGYHGNPTNGIASMVQDPLKR